MAQERRNTIWQSLHILCLRIVRRIRLNFKRKTIFFFSLLITYLLAIGLTLGSIVIQLDSKLALKLSQTDSDVITASENVGNNQDTINEERDVFTFHSCTGLETGLFVAARILETLIPTAITFSGVILILQTDSKEKSANRTLLFLVITLLTIGGIVLPTVKTIRFLEIYIGAFGILCLLSIVFSWKNLRQLLGSTSTNANQVMAEWYSDF